MRRSQKSQNLIMIAQNCINQNNFNQAIKILDQAIQLDPTKDQAYRFKADCLEQLDYKEEAQFYYKKCLQINPFSVICYTNYGILLYHLGRIEEAQKIYQLCLEISPHDPTCLNNYSILLFQTGQLDKAEEICHECLKLDPHNEHYLINMGKIAMGKAQSFVQDSKASELLMEEVKQNVKYMLKEKEDEIGKYREKIEEQEKSIRERDVKIGQLEEQLKKLKQAHEEDENKNLCKICLHKKASYINNQCGHLCTCLECKDVVGRYCPICRTQGAFIRVYASFIKHE